MNQVRDRSRESEKFLLVARDWVSLGLLTAKERGDVLGSVVVEVI